jgi:hypothetical protein
MFRAHWEPLVGLIRVRRKELLLTDPADFTLTVVGDEGAAVLKGLVFDGMSMAYVDAIRTCLREQGFAEAVWRRHAPAGGRTRTLRFKV